MAKCYCGALKVMVNFIDVFLHCWPQSMKNGLLFQEFIMLLYFQAVM